MNQENQHRESQSQQTDNTPAVLTESPAAGDVKQDRRLSDEWGPYYLFMQNTDGPSHRITQSHNIPLPYV